MQQKSSDNDKSDEDNSDTAENPKAARVDEEEDNEIEIADESPSGSRTLSQRTPSRSRHDGKDKEGNKILKLLAQQVEVGKSNNT